MAKRTSNDGTYLENLVALIHEALRNVPDTTIEKNVKVPNKIGKPKGEIDVLIVTKANGIEITTAIECKDYNKPVTVEKIDAFKSKCDRLIGIDKRIIVSSSGFQSQAFEAAYHHGISLYTLNDLSSDKIKEWIDAESVKRIILDNMKLVEIKISLENNQSIQLDLGKNDDIQIRCNEKEVLNVGLFLLNIEGYFITEVTTNHFKDKDIETIDSTTIKIMRRLEPSPKDKLYLNYQERWYSINYIEYILCYHYIIDSFEEITAKSYTKCGSENSEAQIVTLSKDTSTLKFIKSSEAEYKVFSVNETGKNEELIAYN